MGALERKKSMPDSRQGGVHQRKPSTINGIKNANLRQYEKIVPGAKWNCGRYLKFGRGLQ